MAGRKIKDCRQFIESLGTDPDDEQITVNDDAVRQLLRSDLAALSKHLGLKMPSNSLKHELLKVVVFDLNDKCLVSEQYVESFDPPKPVDQSLQQSMIVAEESVEVVQAKSEDRQIELALEQEARQREQELERTKIEVQEKEEQAKRVFEEKKLLIEKEKERERT